MNTTTHDHNVATATRALLKYAERVLERDTFVDPMSAHYGIFPPTHPDERYAADLHTYETAQRVVQRYGVTLTDVVQHAAYMDARADFYAPLTHFANGNSAYAQTLSYVTRAPTPPDEDDYYTYHHWTF